MDEEKTMEAQTEDSWDDISLDDVKDEGEGEQPDEGTATDSQNEEADPQKQDEGEAVAEGDNKDAEEKADLTFELKHLDEVKTVTRDEIIPLAQKGMDYDRVRTKFDTLTAEHTTLQKEKADLDAKIALIDGIAKQQGFENADALIDETRAQALVNQAQQRGQNLDIEVARQRIANDKERAALEAEKAAIAAERENKGKDTEHEEAVKAEFGRFHMEHPDFDPKTAPADFWKDVDKLGIFAAYDKFSIAKAKSDLAAENERLKAELEATKKNAENKAKSAGSQASSGGNKPQDDFDRMWYND